MSRFWSPLVHQLTPYVPGEQPKHQQLIKLNTNENPYPPSPMAVAAIKSATEDGLQLYPDPNSTALCQSIAKYYQLEESQVFVGNGSDEVLAHVFQALLKHDDAILFPNITYSFYPVYCGLFDIEYKTVELNEDLSISVDDYSQKNGGIIIANPNAPTGIALSLAEIERLLKQNSNSVVVIDEAYVDFGADTAASLINQYENLLVIQTLSKSRSLAGLRVGFAMGNKTLIDALYRVKDSFNSYPLDRLALAGAVAAIEDKSYFETSCKKVIESRNYLTEQLSQLGFNCTDSKTNFIFANHEKYAAEELFNYLREQAILVRFFNKPILKDYLRISIGTQEECEALVRCLQQFIDEQ